MKERPILFSGPMVRAILAGRKTMTRRVVKVNASGRYLGCPYGGPGDRLWVRETWATSAYCNERAPAETASHGLPFWYAADGVVNFTGATTGGPEFITRGKWRPSISMPRWASRIALEITNVRCERLQEISEGDAIAEGWKALANDNPGNGGPFDWFRVLWDSTTKKHPWPSDPHVWVIEFKRVSE